MIIVVFIARIATLVVAIVMQGVVTAMGDAVNVIVVVIAIVGVTAIVHS